jgi:hypothetical protein
MRKTSLLLLLALVSTSAAAQETGTRLGRNAGERDIPLILNKIGSCMADTRPATARKWLDLIPGSAAEDQFALVHEGEMNICMALGDKHLVTVGELEYVPLDIRRYMALEAGHRAALTAPDTIPVGVTEKPWFAEALAQMKKGDDLDRKSLVQQDFGHCVVVSNWVGARAFLRTERGSKEEGAALQALAPSLGPCIDAGAKIELNKASVRNAIAEPFYHIASLSGSAVETGK